MTPLVCGGGAADLLTQPPEAGVDPEVQRFARLNAPRREPAVTASMGGDEQREQGAVRCLVRNRDARTGERVCGERCATEGPAVDDVPGRAPA